MTFMSSAGSAFAPLRSKDHITFYNFFRSDTNETGRGVQIWTAVPERSGDTVVHNH